MEGTVQLAPIQVKEGIAGLSLDALRYGCDLFV